MHIVMQLLKSTVVHFGASCMPLCSSRSCLVPPAQHHLQQPRSTATNDRREREQHRRHAGGTRRLSGARLAAAVRAWPELVSDIQAAATPSYYYYYYYYWPAP